MKITSTLGGPADMLELWPLLATVLVYSSAILSMYPFALHGIVESYSKRVSQLRVLVIV